MLVELSVRDFAIIEDLRLRLTPGFNVLTGETGAGKSIIVDAVGQLMGERADSDTVRAGSERALVEGVFETGRRTEAVREVLEAYGIEEDPVLIVSREIHAAGRSTARVNGRSVPNRALSEIGRLLIDVHGQSENASLQREGEHADLLDRYAGLLEERAELAACVRRVRELRAELKALQRDEAELARRADMLRYQVEEIEAAAVDPDEEEELLAERRRLANAEKLIGLSDGAYQALQGGEEDVVGLEGGAIGGLDAAQAALEELCAIDEELQPHAEGLAAAADALAEAARALRAYRDDLGFEPRRLEEVEERLAVLSDLKRKYGPELADVLAFGERAAGELASVSGAGERIEALSAERDALLAEIGRRGDGLRARRFAAGERLGADVEAQLQALGMAGAVFALDLARRPDPEGAPAVGGRYAFDETGLERIAFLVSANPGEPPRPLARVASGGETARIMLALKRILSGADEVPTLVFDEIDAGIGGRIGAVVGEKLWSLSEAHQVLCVTHLPQVAVYGDSHFHVRKGVDEGRTYTEALRLDEPARAAEITEMLGGGDEAARGNAEALLGAAAAWKAEHVGQHGQGGSKAGAKGGTDASMLADDVDDRDGAGVSEAGQESKPKKRKASKGAEAKA